MREMTITSFRFSAGARETKVTILSYRAAVKIKLEWTAEAAGTKRIGLYPKCSGGG
jgi:hypothetical protein